MVLLNTIEVMDCFVCIECQNNALRVPYFVLGF